MSELFKSAVRMAANKAKDVKPQEGGFSIVRNLYYDQGGHKKRKGPQKGGFSIVRKWQRDQEKKKS